MVESSSLPGVELRYKAVQYTQRCCSLRGPAATLLLLLLLLLLVLPRAGGSALSGPFTLATVDGWPESDFFWVNSYPTGSSGMPPGYTNQCSQVCRYVGDMGSSSKSVVVPVGGTLPGSTSQAVCAVCEGHFCVTGSDSTVTINTPGISQPPRGGSICSYSLPGEPQPRTVQQPFYCLCWRRRGGPNAGYGPFLAWVPSHGSCSSVAVANGGLPLRAVLSGGSVLCRGAASAPPKLRMKMGYCINCINAPAGNETKVCQTAAGATTKFDLLCGKSDDKACFSNPRLPLPEHVVETEWPPGCRATGHMGSCRLTCRPGFGLGGAAGAATGPSTRCNNQEWQPVVGQCAPCLDGQMVDPVSGKCVCRPGYAGGSLTKPCKICQAGTFSPGLSFAQCEACPPHYTSAPGATSMEQCTNDPPDCLSGQLLAPGGTSPEDCQCLAGYGDGSTTAPCQLCGPGAFGPGGALGQPCETCPAGTTSLPGASDVVNCFASSCTQAGQAAGPGGNCTCMPGTGGGSVTSPCSKCEPGTYSQGGSFDACKACPAGQTTFPAHYATSADDCWDCGEGQELATSGPLLNQCVCLPGRGGARGPNVILPLCRICLIGWFSPGGSHAPCVQCPKRTTTKQIGATSRSDCVPLT